jgi:hypothetical protein
MRAALPPFRMESHRDACYLMQEKDIEGIPPDMPMTTWGGFAT